MKRQLFLLLLLVSVCGSAYAQQVIDNPFIDRTNASNVIITKVELLEDATVLHITAMNPPNRWIKFSSKTFLKDCNSPQRYRLLKCDGYPFDKEHYMSKGRQDFKMYFEPLSPSVMKFDFIEGYEVGAFRISGVEIRNTLVIDNLLPSITIDVAPGQTIEIPAATLKKLKKNQKMVIRGLGK